MATGENVLYMLERTHRETRKITTRLAYRTRDEAIAAKVKKQTRENARNTGYEWYRRRVTWGAD